MGDRVKGLPGLDLALSRPRWGTLLAVGAFGLALFWNARRLNDHESIFATTGLIAPAAGLLSIAIIVGITASKEGSREDDAWQAAILFLFGALFLTIPQVILASLATLFLGGDYPTRSDRITGALIGGGLQVASLLVYCMVKGARLKPKSTGSAGGGNGTEGRWD